MPSGGHRHLKRLAAPTKWGLTKSIGKYAIRPLPGTHCKELSIPMHYILTKFLKLAHTSKEVHYIIENGLVVVNHKRILNHKSVVGLFDVISVLKSNEHYRLILGVNRKFKLQKVSSEEAKYRLSKVKSKGFDKIKLGEKEVEVPMTRTTCGYNFRLADPSIDLNNTVKIDIVGNKLIESYKFEKGSIVFIYSGSNTGRVGTIKSMEKQPDGKTLIQLVDGNMKHFSTLMTSAMVIGKDEKTFITLDEEKGIKLTEYEKSNLKYETSQVAEE
ncbi:ribosomal prt S4 [Enterospora canceri]|uniref:Ribosomal prt S4 n=1 Tax=Enterospora canceri TaxID=1081671 RepID=A0A1Y1S9H5_9MICR|nr:ribosomal prt S4 [Enterospora canceri]